MKYKIDWNIFLKLDKQNEITMFVRNRLQSIFSSRGSEMQCWDPWRIPPHTTAAAPVLVQSLESNGTEFPLDTQKQPNSVLHCYEHNLHTWENEAEQQKESKYEKEYESNQELNHNKLNKRKKAND